MDVYAILLTKEPHMEFIDTYVDEVSKICEQLDKDKIGKNTTIIPDSLINNFELLTSEIDLNLLNFKF